MPFHINSEVAMRQHPHRRLLSLFAAMLLVGSLAFPAAAADEATGSVRAASVTDGDASLAQFFGGVPDRSGLDFACPPGDFPTGSFPDASAGAFGTAVDCLAWYDITQGVSPGVFNPGGNVTRGQMAVFIYRTIQYTIGLYELDMPEWDGASAFPDVPTSLGAAEAINVLSSDLAVDTFGQQIVAGTADGSYRPSAPVTREQMGTFLARSLEGIIFYLDSEFPDDGFELLPGECGDTFPDRNTISDVHDANVNLICSGGIATGRADGTFDPRANVTRGQMAAFLMRTQDFLVEFQVSLPPEPVEDVDAPEAPTPPADGAVLGSCSADGLDVAVTLLEIGPTEFNLRPLNLAGTISNTGGFTSDFRPLVWVSVFDSEGELFDGEIVSPMQRLTNYEPFDAEIAPGSTTPFVLGSYPLGATDPDPTSVEVELRVLTDVLCSFEIEL
jgi:hypothetical protein